MSLSKPIDVGHVQLTIGGMTCASCAARIERRLNKLDGVTATVNYATEKADVRYPSTVSPDDLVAAVKKVGYSAALPAPPVRDEDESGERADEDSTRSLRQRLLVSLVLTVPVILLAMVPALQFTS